MTDMTPHHLIGFEGDSQASLQPIAGQSALRFADGEGLPPKHQVKRP
ncbi:hypothetical protein [Streptomyces noursei]